MEQQKNRSDIKILSIGAAVQDVYLKGALFEPVCEPDGDCVEEFQLGSKNDLDEVISVPAAAQLMVLFRLPVKGCTVPIWVKLPTM